MQSYKIYINDKPLILTSTKDINLYTDSNDSTLIIRYAGKAKYLLNYIDSLEKGNKYDRIVLHSVNYKQLKSDLKSLLNIIKAGGGIVENEYGETLFIFRKGYWDLPKGKCDTGEKRKVAASREVEEETGVQGLVRHKLFAKTKHLYREKGVRSLKVTNWYLMSAPKQELVPEAKEQIEKAVWIRAEDFLEYYRPVYRSVREIIENRLAQLEKDKQSIQV
jgi:8-oxo-dGTP pyrophosphatase MutT (NUDIX family)